MVASVLTVFLFSVSAVFATKTAREMGGIRANFWRLLFAFVLLAIYAHTLGQGIAGEGLWLMMLSGVVGFGMGDLALFQALPRIGAQLTVLLAQCLAAPIAALTEWIWLGTVLSVAQMVAALAILTGVVIALYPKKGESPHEHLFAGVLWGVVAAAGQAWGAVMSRKAFEFNLSSGIDIDGMTAAYQRCLAGILCAFIAFLWISCQSQARKASVATKTLLAWIVLNGLAGPFLGVSCYQWALKTTASGVVLPIVATTPLAVIPLAWVLDGERPSVRSIVGGMISVGGVVFLILASR